MIIAEVCVNVVANSVRQNFTYRVPERLKYLSAGWRVVVPFGAKTFGGFVMSVQEVDDATTFDFELKDIAEAIDEEPWFTPEMMSAAHWLSEFYLCPLSMAMGLFMPGRRGKRISARFERVLTLAKDFDEQTFGRAPARLRLLKLIAESGELRLSGQKVSAAMVKALVEAGYVKVEQRRLTRDS